MPISAAMWSAIGDIGQGPKVEDLAQGEGASHDGKLIVEIDAAVWLALFAPVTRQVAPSTVEQESHLTLPLT